MALLALLHSILGLGDPVAAHSRVALSNSDTTTLNSPVSTQTQY